MKLEKDIEKYLTKRIESAVGMSLKWVCPGHQGVPDRIIIMPDSLLFFVELKRPKGGSVDKLQILWGRHLAQKGQNVFIIKNKAEVDALVDILRYVDKNDNFMCFENGGFFAFDDDLNLIYADRQR